MEVFDSGEQNAEPLLPYYLQVSHSVSEDNWSKARLALQGI